MADWFADLSKRIAASPEPIAWAKPEVIYYKKPWRRVFAWKVFGCPFCDGKHVHEIEATTWDHTFFHDVGVFPAACDNTKQYRLFDWHTRDSYIMRNSLNRKPISAELRDQVASKTDGRCWYCGANRQYCEVDHVAPVAFGGTNHIRNLVLACPSCNAAKKIKTLEQFRISTMLRLTPTDRRRDWIIDGRYLFWAEIADMADAA